MQRFFPFAHPTRLTKQWHSRKGNATKEQGNFCSRDRRSLYSNERSQEASILRIQKRPSKPSDCAGREKVNKKGGERLGDE